MSQNFSVVVNNKENKALNIDFKGTFKQFKDKISKESKILFVKIYYLDENKYENQITNEKEFKNYINAFNSSDKIKIYIEEELPSSDLPTEKRDLRNTKYHSEDPDSKINRKPKNLLNQLNIQKSIFKREIAKMQFEKDKESQQKLTHMENWLKEYSEFSQTKKILKNYFKQSHKYKELLTKS
jgi:hypothetical protein